MKVADKVTIKVNPPTNELGILISILRTVKNLITNRVKTCKAKVHRCKLRATSEKNPPLM